MSWPYSSPFTFPGGGDRPTRLAGDYPVEVLDDHCTRGLTRLIEPWKGKPNLEAILCAILDQVEEVEYAAQDVLRADTIDTGLDDQLDRDGKIVGAEARSGMALDRYRLIVKATVLVNKSDGLGEEFNKILDILFPTREWEVLEVFPTAIRVNVFGLIDETEANITHRLLYRAKDVGVRLHTVYSLADSDDTFQFSSTSSPEASVASGFGDATDPETGGKLAGTF